MARIGNIDIAMRAGTDQLERDLSRGSQKIHQFSKTGGSSATRLSGAMKNIGPAAAAAAAAAAIAWAKMSFDAGQELDRTAKKAAELGMELNALREIQLVGDLSGIDASALESALTRQIDHISTAVKERSKALEELGLDAERLNALKPEESLLRIADALDRVKNKSDKVRLARDIWGKEGAALLNLGGAAEIEKQMADAGKVIGHISSEAVAATERMNDRLTSLWAAAKGGAAATYAAFAQVSEDVGGFLKKWTGLQLIDDWANNTEAATKAAEENKKVMKQIADEEERAARAAAKRRDIAEAIANKTTEQSTILDKLRHDRQIAYGSTEESMLIDRLSKGYGDTFTQQQLAEIKQIQADIARAKKENSATDWIKSQETEAATFGMSARAATIYQMEQDGVLKSIIDQARAIDQKLTALEKEKDATEKLAEAQKKAREDARSMVDASRSEADELQEKIKKAREYVTQGLMTGDEYRAVLSKMRADLREPEADRTEPTLQWAGMVRQGSVEDYKARVRAMLPDQNKPLDKLVKGTDEQTKIIREMKAVIAENFRPPQVFSLN